MGDFLKAFPNYTERDYMYKLSAAKVNLLSSDFTHTKYLEGKDKEKWEKYCSKQKQSDDVVVVRSVQEYNQYKTTGKAPDSNLNGDETKVVVISKHKKTEDKS